MSFSLEKYLGDGLYASFDGYRITLRAPREDGDHYVVLKPEVLAEFIDYLNHLSSMKLTVSYER